MRQTTRRKTHLIGLLLALAVFAGGLVPPGRSQQRARSGGSPPRSQAQQSQGTTKQRPSTAAAGREGDDANASVIPPEPVGKIAFASDRAGNFDIYVMNPDGSGLVRVTDDPAEDTHPTWSPDGRSIAFVSTRDGNKEIYVVGAEGGPATRLTNNAAEDFSPAWSTNVANPRILFVSRRTGNDEVFVMNADGTGQTNVTNNPADDNDPQWLLTSNTTLITYASNRDGDKFEIYRANADGTGPVRLTANSFNDVHPAWPAGRIVFQSDRDGNDELYVMNAANGTGQINITNNPAFDLDPTTTSDGSRVVWVSNRGPFNGTTNTDNLDIYAANTNGSLVIRLTDSPASDIDPAVQPLPSAATLGTFQLTQPAITVSEGTRFVELTVTRTGGTGSASVEISTVSGSADERNDFSAISRRLYFGPGETSRTVRLSIIDDRRVEGDETLTVTLSDPFNATIGPVSSTTVTIIDNDTGTSGLRFYGVNNLGQFIRFRAEPVPGVVPAPGIGGPLQIEAIFELTGLQPNETVLGMDVRPANRQLYLLGSTGRIYIVNTDTGAARLASTLSMALSGTSFGVDFNPTVDRLRIVSDADQNLRVNVDTGAVVAVDTALAYAAGDTNAGQNPSVVAVAYTNNFAGATSTTLYDIDSARDVLTTQNPPNAGVLNTVGPLGVDTSEVISFDIVNPGGLAFAMLRVNGNALLYQINLATGAATLFGHFGPTGDMRAIAFANPRENPIDETGFFVRQHYLDFLGREPEPSGFNAWVNVLENCPDQFNNSSTGPSVLCDRVFVSSAFVRSPEFAQRGAFVVRSYIAAYGRLPTFREFLRDLMALGGDTDAEALANRARFPDDFTQRPEFGAIYDSLSNAAYVDRLIQNSGATIPAAARDQLVADLNSGAKTRAQVFREIVDRQEFVNAAFNRVFVLMQYFGYLRRDPEPTGFQAWLNYLNAHPDDFRTMVFGFVNSQEYRRRFGPP
jgi:Tol biopolymer transport system component